MVLFKITTEKQQRNAEEEEKPQQERKHGREAHIDKIQHFASLFDCRHVYDLHTSVIFGLHFCLQTVEW